MKIHLLLLSILLSWTVSAEPLSGKRKEAWDDAAAYFSSIYTARMNLVAYSGYCMMKYPDLKQKIDHANRAWQQKNREIEASVPRVMTNFLKSNQFSDVEIESHLNDLKKNQAYLERKFQAQSKFLVFKTLNGVSKNERKRICINLPTDILSGSFDAFTIRPQVEVFYWQYVRSQP